MLINANKNCADRAGSFSYGYGCGYSEGTQRYPSLFVPLGRVVLILSPQSWVLRAWNKQMGLTHPEKIYIFSCSWEVKLARNEVQGTGQLALLSPRASRELFGSSDSLLAALEFSLKTTLFWKELTLKRAPGGRGLREEAV